MSLRRMWLFPVALALSGCWETTPEKADAGQDREIDRVIAAALDRASRANDVVAGAEAAVIAPERAGPGQDRPAGVRLTPELLQTVNIDWHGPVEPMLAALAARANYEFRVVGKPPATPVMVSLKRQRTPLFELVRESGIVIHEHGDVALSMAARRIELRYGP